MKKPRVFVTGSLWALFVYLMYNDLDDIKRTHYFLTDKGIHPSVRRNFKHHHVLNISWDDKLHWRLVHLLFIFIPFINRLRWPYLLWCDMWGIDQGLGIQSIIGRKSYTLIEDGAIDYMIDRNIVSKKGDWLRRLLWGPIYRHDIGRNDSCKRIILTQPATNDILRAKAEEINLHKLWNEASEEKKEYILHVFNLTLEDVEMMKKRKVILLTQPFSLDCQDFTDDDQIKMYHEMIKPYGEENVIIKPHPREKLSYQGVIPGTMVMDKPIPFQFFDILGVKFDAAITVSSTSVMSLAGGNTTIDFKGTTIDERLKKACGVITKDSIFKKV